MRCATLARAYDISPNSTGSYDKLRPVRLFDSECFLLYRGSTDKTAATDSGTRAPAASATFTSTYSGDGLSDGSDGGGKGWIAGTVIGPVVGSAISIFALGYWFARRRLAQRQHPSHEVQTILSRNIWRWDRLRLLQSFMEKPSRPLGNN